MSVNAMSPWYYIRLGDATLAWEPLANLERMFRSEFAKAGEPHDMAVFTRHESLGDLHCELVAYLSPASVVVAGAVDAAPCARPLANGLSLLSGSTESWRVLFPERTG